MAFGMFSDKKREEQERKALNQERLIHSENNMMANATPSTGVDEQYWHEDEARREELTKWQQNLEPELQQMVMDLRRQYIDSEGNVRQRTDAKDNPLGPVCTEEAINNIVALARANTSKNLMMCNYSEQNILDEIRSIYRTFIMHIGFFYKKYEIDKGDLSYVLRLFKSHIRPTFYRALNDGERRLQRTIQKRIETVAEHRDKKQTNFMGFGG